MPRPSHHPANWPDADGSDSVTCHKCGHQFAAYATNPTTGNTRGRDRCPRCDQLRRMGPREQELYAQWSGLITWTARDARREGPLAEDEAERIAGDAFVEALFRWVPELGEFQTFAVAHIRQQFRRGWSLRQDRPATFSRQAMYDAHAENIPYGGNAAGVHWSNHGSLDPVVGPDTGAIDDADEAEHRAATVAAALAQLPPELAEVVRRRFGLSGERPQSRIEVGIAVGITKEGVRLRELKALDKLRFLLGDYFYELADQDD